MTEKSAVTYLRDKGHTVHLMSKLPYQTGNRYIIHWNGVGGSPDSCTAAQLIAKAEKVYAKQRVPDAR